MSSAFDTTPENPAAAPSTPSPPSRTRPFYWSVRRELWENRSITLAPLVAAGVVLFGFLLSAVHLPRRMRAAELLDPGPQADALAEPYHILAFAVFLTMLLVAIFHCLGALHGERRDRSILFWKSLPVSDLITVLSKASIPMLALPLIAFVIVVAGQWIMLLLSTLVLLLHGPSPLPLWTQLPILRLQIELLYSLAAVALWYAPIYAWLLMVSGWARRAPFLWALLPPLALCLIEKIAFDTTHLGSLLVDRVIGFKAAAFSDPLPGQGKFGQLALLNPVQFLSTPGLWTGLVIAAAFIAAAVWFRRRREPI